MLQAKTTGPQQQWPQKPRQKNCITYKTLSDFLKGQLLVVLSEDDGALPRFMAICPRGKAVESKLLRITP